MAETKRNPDIACIRSPVVLLIDDQPIVGEKLRRILSEEADITFHYCQDPGNALEVVSEIKPTVILQDLVMPGVDGLTVVKMLRVSEETSSVPIIVLSTNENPTDKSLAFEAGASDYLVKMPNAIELIARIRAHTKSYLMQLERDDAYRKLREVQSELEKSNEELRRLSSLDGLTGVANRRRFDEFATKEWRRAVREKVSISLILIDIDYFKAYNDNYGHQKGDETLIRVAECLDSGYRRPADLLARYGGEEFVVVLPDTSLKGAEQLAETLRENVETLNIGHAFSQAADHVTISLGVASCTPNPGISKLSELINAADKALYEAKRRGRNQVCSHENCVKKKASPE